MSRYKLKFLAINTIVVTQLYIALCPLKDKLSFKGNLLYFTVVAPTLCFLKFINSSKFVIPG